jgi:site-specific DNA-methyltransferase (adenine-specific)
MNSEVFLMDCMEGMKGYPDKYFELAIVDPPYGIDYLHAGGMCAENGWKQYERKDWDKSIPDSPYFLELKRVSANQIIWGGNYFDLGPTQCYLIWDKGQRDFSLADAELAWTSFEKSVRVFDFARALANQENKIHPTQKPISLYKWLLKNYAKEGDKILDTHLGSGSSRIAAFEMGFDFTGYEIDKDYFEASEKRFQQYKSQLKLFQL